MNTLRIALAVTASMVGRVEDNLDRMAHWAAIARKNGTTLLCFPEMNITGYSSGPGIADIAQPVPGPASDRVSALAVCEGMTILAGLAESDGKGRYFASHLVATPDGAVRVYRKMHVAPPEKKIFSGGEQVPLFYTQEVTFGVQLCYDAHFPELSTKMAVMGADVIFLPHASPRGTPREKLRSWMRHLSARAFDNGVFIAAVNQAGDNGSGLSFPGVAVVLGPDGEILCRDTEGKEGLLFADLTDEKLQGVRGHPMRYFLPSRRTDIFPI